jgi:hypothetical protein
VEGAPVTARIATLYVSYATEQKIIQKHRIQIDELEEVLVDVRGLKATWDDDPQRGRRVLIEVFIRGRAALVVLYPTDVADEWNLGSAYFV